MPAGSRRRFLIVDGHSIIFHWPDLRALHDRQRRRARAELVRRLTAYQDASGESVLVVFDSRSQREIIPDPQGPAAIRIEYATPESTADSIIERLVAAHGSTSELTVATGDHAERSLVEALGAWTISPDGLRQRIEHVTSQSPHRAPQKKSARRSPSAGFPIADAFPPPAPAAPEDSEPEAND